MQCCTVRAWIVKRMGCLLVPAGLLLALGCGGSGPNYDSAEVSGKVTYKGGKPLPGGQITFTAKNGGLSNGGRIEEDGTYKVKAPIGECMIAVDNRALQQNVKGAGKAPLLKRPGAEAPETLKGHYVEIPRKYYTATESGLTMKVERGTNTKDFELQ